MNLPSQITPALAREIAENLGDLEIVIFEHEEEGLLTFGIFREFGQDGKPLFSPEPFTKKLDEVLEILEFSLNGIRTFYGPTEESYFTQELISEILSACRVTEVVTVRKLLRKSA